MTTFAVVKMHRASLPIHRKGKPLAERAPNPMSTIGKHPLVIDVGPCAACHRTKRLINGKCEDCRTL